MPAPNDYWNRRSARIDEILESWRAATAFAGVALKSAILLNGAAAVAILAFIANQWSAPVEVQQSPNDAADLVPVLRHFLVGTFAAVLASGVGYLSAYAENRGIWRWVKKSETEKAWFFCSRALQIIAVGIIIYAYVRFWLGMGIGIQVLGGGA